MRSFWWSQRLPRRVFVLETPHIHIHRSMSDASSSPCKRGAEMQGMEGVSSAQDGRAPMDAPNSMRASKRMMTISWPSLLFAETPHGHLILPLLPRHVILVNKVNKSCTFSKISHHLVTASSYFRVSGTKGRRTSPPTTTTNRRNQ